MFDLYGEGRFGRNAARAASEGDYYDVIAHGTPNRIQIGLPDGRTFMFDHRTAARLTENQSDYTGQAIRMLSCNPGSCATGNEIADYY